MTFSLSVTLTISLILVAQTALSEESKSNLTILNSHGFTNWGPWGPSDNCPKGQFVIGFELKTMPKLGPKEDNTGVNGIRMFCGTQGSPSKILTTINSTIGPWGHWGGGGTCPNGYVNGFKLRHVPPQGCRDDVSTTDILLYCSGKVPTVTGNNLDWGLWTGKQKCPTGQVICGFRTQVEIFQGDQRLQICFAFDGDDTALNNIETTCCKP